MEKFEITCSIVVYKEDLEDLFRTIESFLSVKIKKHIYLIDNTKSNFYKYVFNDNHITYVPNNYNSGFGSGHNLILNKIENISKYHLILNPDVYFKENVIRNLIYRLNDDVDIAMIAPKVLFPNDKHQYSCRRYPSLTELLVRRFYLKNIFKKTIQKGIYTDRNLNQSFNPDYLTGCFHLYKTEDFIKLEGFDERYFLYMEDVDICKKIDKLGKKKLYYPKVEITHVLKQGSAKSTKLFFVHTLSAIKYFLKWGFK
jgi:GT2 family glycosyltransferase